MKLENHELPIWPGLSTAQEGVEYRYAVEKTVCDAEDARLN